MHEFSLCEAILKQIAKVNGNNLSNVKEVTIEIGELVNVDVNSLNFWFPVVVKSKFNTEITLRINQIEAIARCNNCFHQFKISDFYQPCTFCKEFGNYVLISGQQMLIKSFKSL